MNRNKVAGGLVKPLDPNIKYDVISHYNVHGREVSDICNDFPLTSREAEYFASGYLQNGFRLTIEPTKLIEKTVSF